ncbi:MAG: hypothetical protein AAF791_09955 [Bacteroidota bacterium]
MPDSPPISTCYVCGASALVYGVGPRGQTGVECGACGAAWALVPRGRDSLGRPRPSWHRLMPVLDADREHALQVAADTLAGQPHAW